MPSGAELFVEAAARLGLDTFFTLVGDHLNEVLAAAARRGIRILLNVKIRGVRSPFTEWQIAGKKK